MTRRMEFNCGTTIERAAHRMAQTANLENCTVITEFNGIELTVSPTATARKIVEHYNRAISARENNPAPKSLVIHDNGVIESSNITGAQLVVQARNNPSSIKAIYALLWENDTVKTDVVDGKYYWTDREGTRKRIVDLSTNHLEEILKMPDFKGSRLTQEMRDAIRNELVRRLWAGW